MRLYNILGILSIIKASMSMSHPLCPMYRCSLTPNNTERKQTYASAPLNTTVCSNQTKTIFQSAELPLYTLSMCKKEERCELTPSSTPMPLIQHCFQGNILPKSLLPGEHCNRGSECKGGRCEGTTEYKSCSGLETNSLCISSTDCGVGMYCSPQTFKCKKLTEVSGICNRERDKCWGYAICENGQCVLKGSLPLGAPALNPEACQSWFTYQDAAGSSLCHQGPSLMGSNLCLVGDMCIYRFTHNPYLMHQEICTCGNSMHGYAYCHIGLANYLSNISTLISYIQTKPKCHILNPLFCNTVEKNEEFYRAFVILYQIERNQLLQDNDYCTMQVMHKEYYDALLYLDNLKPHPPNIGYSTSNYNQNILICLWLPILLLKGKKWSVCLQEIDNMEFSDNNEFQVVTLPKRTSSKMFEHIYYKEYSISKKEEEMSLLDVPKSQSLYAVSFQEEELKPQYLKSIFQCAGKIRKIHIGEYRHRHNNRNKRKKFWFGIIVYKKEESLGKAMNKEWMQSVITAKGKLIYGHTHQHQATIGFNPLGDKQPNTGINDKLVEKVKEMEEGGFTIVQSTSSSRSKKVKEEDGVTTMPFISKAFAQRLLGQKRKEKEADLGAEYISKKEKKKLYCPKKPGFYQYQIRQNMKSEIEELRKGFEEDKRKMLKLKKETDEISQQKYMSLSSMLTWPESKTELSEKIGYLLYAGISTMFLIHIILRIHQIIKVKNGKRTRMIIVVSTIICSMVCRITSLIFYLKYEYSGILCRLALLPNYNSSLLLFVLSDYLVKSIILIYKTSICGEEGGKGGGMSSRGMLGGMDTSRGGNETDDPSVMLERGSVHSYSHGYSCGGSVMDRVPVDDTHRDDTHRDDVHRDDVHRDIHHHTQHNILHTPPTKSPSPPLPIYLRAIVVGFWTSAGLQIVGELLYIGTYNINHPLTMISITSLPLLSIVSVLWYYSLYFYFVIYIKKYFPYTYNGLAIRKVFCNGYMLPIGTAFQGITALISAIQGYDIFYYLQYKIAREEDVLVGEGLCIIEITIVEYISYLFLIQFYSDQQKGGTDSNNNEDDRYSGSDRSPISSLMSASDTQSAFGFSHVTGNRGESDQGGEAQGGEDSDNDSELTITVLLDSFVETLIRKDSKINHLLVFE